MPLRHLLAANGPWRVGLRCSYQCCIGFGVQKHHWESPTLATRGRSQLETLGISTHGTSVGRVQRRQLAGGRAGRPGLVEGRGRYRCPACCTRPSCRCAFCSVTLVCNFGPRIAGPNNEQLLRHPGVRGPSTPLLCLLCTECLKCIVLCSCNNGSVACPLPACHDPDCANTPTIRSFAPMQK